MNKATFPNGAIIDAPRQDYKPTHKTNGLNLYYVVDGNHVYCSATIDNGAWIKSNYTLSTFNEEIKAGYLVPIKENMQ